MINLKQRKSDWNKKYYLKNRDKILLRMSKLDIVSRNARLLKSQKARIKTNKLFVRDYLRENKCIDCGESDFRVLDFHHIKDKFKSISDMLRKGFSLIRIKQEIEKCVVVCGNCHAKRHTNKNPRRQTKKYEFVQDIKRKSKCSKCGFNQCSTALHFHHKKDKIEGIAKMSVQAQYSLEDIVLEMKKCIILCANCHKRLHQSLILKS